MTTYIELVVTACLATAPLQCEELRLPTGFTSVHECATSGGMLLAAGVMLDRPLQRLTRFTCHRVPLTKDT